MKKISLALAAVALVGTSAPAMADPPSWAKAHGKRYKDRQYYTTSNGIRYWRDEDGRYRCRRSDGTVGLIVGAAAGALAGRAIDTRGERATGTVLGAAAGALLGREVDRGRRISCR
ncbi:glycine zipper 2TM domain-containing protein [Qipengyuania sediminis]|uniref:glycine zipper 2TM domain-containing protein n=1 Tax=Qipengyuania sediminis TaxID=1532023 RepID=UPI0010595F7F|nr:glycine zipper 2TM domain-containing protein [Qipengyuania sediminis]